MTREEETDAHFQDCPRCQRVGDLAAKMLVWLEDQGFTIDTDDIEALMELLIHARKLDS